MATIAELPKAELHLHLDCSLSHRAVCELAGNITLDEYLGEYVAPSPCIDLADFLKRPPKSIALMQDEAALRLVTEDVFQQLRADNVIYAEIRFAPLLHTERGLDPERIVSIVNDTAERMSRETGVESRLILCTLRHFTEDQSMRTVRLVEMFRGTRVAAFDLAGDEAGFPITPHIEAFEYAQNQGLYRTAHAGEGLGAESVRETVHSLNPTRIGHGTRSMEDPACVEYLRERKIHLELCPSANVQIIPTIDNMAAHPIDRLYRANISLNINSDSRTLTPTTLTREYQHVCNVFGWGREELLRTNLMAIDAAFVDGATKAALRRIMEQAYEA